MTVFENALQKALDEKGYKSWFLYFKIWIMKAIWNFNSRKFQGLMIGMFIAHTTKANGWIVFSLLITYVGGNVADHWELFKKKV